MKLPRGYRHRALIVDDIAAVRRLVRLALDEAGRFDVVGEAADGAEAVEAASSLRPDLIVLDLSMPGMDGLDALPHLRRVSPQSCIIIHTGQEHEALARVGLEHGAHDYVQKGMAPEALVHRLLTVLETTESARGQPVAARATVRRSHADKD